MRELVHSDNAALLTVHVVDATLTRAIKTIPAQGT